MPQISILGSDAKIYDEKGGVESNIIAKGDSQPTSNEIRFLIPKVGGGNKATVVITLFNENMKQIDTANGDLITGTSDMQMILKAADVTAKIGGQDGINGFLNYELAPADFNGIGFIDFAFTGTLKGGMFTTITEFEPDEPIKIVFDGCGTIKIRVPFKVV